MKAAYQKLDDSARAMGFKTCGKVASGATAAAANASPAILKNVFIAKADARCAAANKEFDAIPEPTSAKQALDSSQKVVVIAQRLIADLRTIAPAPADKATVDEFLAENERAVAKLDEALSALRAGQLDRADALAEQATEASGSGDLKADRFGFRDCGSAGTPS